MTRSQGSEVPAFSGLSYYRLRNYTGWLKVSPVIWKTWDAVYLPQWMEHANENNNFYLNPLRVWAFKYKIDKVYRDTEYAIRQNQDEEKT